MAIYFLLPSRRALVTNIAIALASISQRSFGCVPSMVEIRICVNRIMVPPEQTELTESEQQRLEWLAIMVRWLWKESGRPGFKRHPHLVVLPRTS